MPPQLDHKHKSTQLHTVIYAVVLSFALWWVIAAAWHASPIAIEDLRCRIELLEGTPEPDGAIAGDAGCP